MNSINYNKVYYYSIILKIHIHNNNNTKIMRANNERYKFTNWIFQNKKKIVNMYICTTI